MNRFLTLCLAIVALVGCESMPFSPFISPRVTGRVLAADTGKPLADVTVKSGAHRDDARGVMPPKGGELLMAKSPARTDRDGRFALNTERVLTPFRSAGWFSVRLSFERAGYERFRTNYSSLNVCTNSPDGKPWLNAGEILLHPVSK
ncbi:MAG: hypothetical protein NT154_38750 [Verrucomicrobia bacterium]|nr:hypothetical protein [Verrucomicrobiota bacterium]